MRSFVKYPGGKTKEIPVVKKYMPVSPKRYIEPFIGGGSIYFALNIHPSYINDKSQDLYYLYLFIQKQNSEFKESLFLINDAWKSIEKKNFLVSISKYKFIDGALFKKYYAASSSRKARTIKKFEEAGKMLSNADKDKMELTARKTALYMIVRDIYNKVKEFNALHCAAFYFLREYCYSSMFRFSSKGDFNVPYGGMTYNLKYMDSKLEYMFGPEIAKYMSDTIIGNKDFEEFLDDVNLNSDDFIFLDPPYDSDFSTYDKNEFDKNEQIRLRDYLAKTQAKWMLIIKKTDFIYNLYRNFSIKEYDMSYMVSFKNRNDRETKHLIITNY